MTLKEELQDVFRLVFEDRDLIIEEATTTDHIDGWDSLSHLNLLMSVEKHFEIHLNTAEITDLENVGDLLALLRARTGRE